MYIESTVNVKYKTTTNIQHCLFQTNSQSLQDSVQLYMNAIVYHFGFSCKFELFRLVQTLFVICASCCGFSTKVNKSDISTRDTGVS